ncbi:protein of unknown function [Candidatus Methylomirabilis oxygeniifera]|uniref:Uncharacterized protein n=1 Tax=Methylomirabilis oxygeniifera TaxID=671143 RepID=D5MIR7_METO1|nr:protein of unknown function [Candidatus Methylomirabilis oxyfera]
MAAQVAPVGHRQTQTAKRPAQGVKKYRGMFGVLVHLRLLKKRSTIGG